MYILNKIFFAPVTALQIDNSVFLILKVFYQCGIILTAYTIYFILFYICSDISGKSNLRFCGGDPGLHHISTLCGDRRRFFIKWGCTLVVSMLQMQKELSYNCLCASSLQYIIMDNLIKILQFQPWLGWHCPRHQECNFVVMHFWQVVIYTN